MAKGGVTAYSRLLVNVGIATARSDLVKVLRLEQQLVAVRVGSILEKHSDIRRISSTALLFTW